jgi:dihydrodiol dehydrogenase / D-xylose 1-dehydrogenase (NADP)
MATKWGILSAGNISHSFVEAVRTLPEGDHQVSYIQNISPFLQKKNHISIYLLVRKFVAVAARELKSAQQFATLEKIPKAYGSYEELAKDPNVEVVYIGTINSAHLPTAKLMLENGKHVLCEKPFTLNLKREQNIITLIQLTFINHNLFGN